MQVRNIDTLTREDMKQIFNKYKATEIFEHASKLFKAGVITSGEMFQARLIYDTYGRTSWKDAR